MGCIAPNKEFKLEENDEQEITLISSPTQILLRNSAMHYFQYSQHFTHLKSISKKI